MRLDVGKMFVGVVMVIAVLSVAPSASLAGAPLRDLTPGHWVEIADSRLETVFPRPPPQGNTGPRSVMDAWSGGVYDTRRDRLIVWGGGHLDYAGNEIYAFDVDQLAWERLTDPSPSKQIMANAARYADGRPSARHTYNNLQYAPEIDALISLGFSAAYGDPSADGHAVDAFTFSTGRWQAKASKPANGHPTGAVSGYDPATGKLWHHGTADGRLVAYDPVRDTWSRPYGDHYLEHYATAAVDPTRGILVATGGSKNNQVMVWNLKNPGAPEIVDTAGNRRLEAAHAPGFVYHARSDRFIAWSGGASVYALDPDTWIWTKVTPAASNSVAPTPPNETGTNGRFRYIPSLDAFILVNRTSENVYLYRLP